jgi:3-methyladenine DNA glycosylase AlkD
MLQAILKDFKKFANPEKAKLLRGFFKTGKGQYGEGDTFLGLIVPQQRLLSKKYSDLSLTDLQELLDSKIHEHRLTALFILISQYKQADSKGKQKIYKFYLKNTKNINNWDLIDLSAPNIVGDYLLNHESEQKILYKLVKSKSLWERRIAILTTFTFIRNNSFNHTLKIAELLLKDQHDLIHKAVGWMLRELGKRDEELLCKLLDKYKNKMPRTMLRYAIEKFSKEKKEYYIKKE